MTVVIRSRVRVRSWVSFAVSVGVHGSILGWLALSPAAHAPVSLYDQQIRPHEDRIIWYRLSEKLPEVAPEAPRPKPQPPRALRKFEQTVVSGKKDDARPPQMIFTPAPEIASPKPLPLPNVVAVAPAPRALRRFIAPPERPRPAPASPDLADAPRLAANITPKALPIDAAVPRPLRRSFTAPAPPRQAAPAIPVLPAAPEMNTVSPPAASLAIVGLNPVNTLEVPRPPNSREAGFSAGPKPQPDANGGADPGDASLTVPGLLVRGAKIDQPSLRATLSPTSHENLLAAARIGVHSAPAGSLPTTRAARVSSSPDPRWEGRVIYTLAIQMPNVTSYSGSWIVWFAERASESGQAAENLRPPQPLHKVDPKYIVSAMEERVEGKVRLSAIIRRNGHVDSVELLQHLDQRLDRSAEEALAKWEFEPALRNGSPVDVDAVFEIPFRLAPRPTH
jgi:TonB family protein